MSRIENAIISVSDKNGIIDFGRGLKEIGVTLLSTGGTARTLKESGVDVIEVSEYTGFPEMMDGRVKTLHPKIHGGLLARRDNPDDMKALKQYNIKSIDMVVVNLYPFKETVSRPDVTMNEAIENIDIGGPSMLRAAAKNFKDVIVIVDPDDYNNILDDLISNGDLSYTKRLSLARKVFSHTSKYDSTIFDYLLKAEEKKL